MNVTELTELIDRVTEQLDNNWAVDKGDIRVLLEMTKQVPIHTDFNQGRKIRVLKEDLDSKQLIDEIIGKKYLCKNVGWTETFDFGLDYTPRYREMEFSVLMLSSGDVSHITKEELAYQIFKRLK